MKKHSISFLLKMDETTTQRTSGVRYDVFRPLKLVIHKIGDMWGISEYYTGMPVYVDPTREGVIKKVNTFFGGERGQKNISEAIKSVKNHEIINGKKKPCTFDPTPYPAQMFHCPECGMMIMGGQPHLKDEDTNG